MSEQQDSELLEMREGGRAFRDRVSNPWAFRAYMMVKMPVLGITGSYLTHLGPRRAELVTPFGWGTKNLFGGLFDSAVMAAVETTTLSLIVLHSRNQQADLAAELTHVEIGRRASVKQQVRVRCDQGLKVARAVESAGAACPHEFSLHATVDSEGGRRTHDVALRWRLIEAD